MSEEPHPTAIACREYQRLLEESESARGSWDRSRAEVCRSRLIGKEKGDELLRFEAKYARAYMLLQKHVNTCVECGSAPRAARFKQTLNKFVTTGSQASERQRLLRFTGRAYVHL